MDNSDNKYRPCSKSVHNVYKFNIAYRVVLEIFRCTLVNKACNTLVLSYPMPVTLHGVRNRWLKKTNRNTEIKNTRWNGWIRLNTDIIHTGGYPGS